MLAALMILVGGFVFGSLILGAYLLLSTFSADTVTKLSPRLPSKTGKISSPAH
jgi:hypothetical protein